MELVLIGALFSVMNFGAMTGFVEGYEALTEPNPDTQVEIYELTNVEGRSESSTENELVISSVSNS